MQDVENSVLHLFAGMPAKKKINGCELLYMAINNVMWNRLFAL